MKCKQHPCERTVGVCASCLRDRLLALAASQNELTAAAAAPDHHRRRSDPAAPPLAIPRSASPHRRSDASASSIATDPCHRRRFFSTPQLGPTFEAASRIGGGGGGGGGAGRFSLISALFGGSEPSRPSRSGSWISGLIRGRRKGKSRTLAPSFDRGMSPSRDDDCESSPANWRRAGTAASTPLRRAVTLSGFAVCLSPLVRASPGGRRGDVVGISGDLRVLPSPRHHRHASLGVPALGPNRSRKLADFGGGSFK